jgi:hypothetical protein
MHNTGSPWPSTSKYMSCPLMRAMGMRASSWLIGPEWGTDDDSTGRADW